MTKGVGLPQDGKGTADRAGSACRSSSGPLVSATLLVAGTQ